MLSQILEGFSRESNALVNVLLVEDNLPDADLTIEALNSRTGAHFSVSHVVTLCDAVSYLASHEIDIVLLDLSLPDSNGFETIEHLLKTFPHIPVVVFTGYDDETFGRKAVKAGAQDYLVKGQTDPILMSRVLLHSIERKFLEIEKTEALKREHKAREEAEKAVGIRDEFLSIATHELRTPLTALKLQIALVKKLYYAANKLGQCDLHFIQILERAEIEIERFSRLVDTLLDFSTIQSGHLSLMYSRFDFVSLVQETVNRLQPEFQRVQSELEIIAPQSLVGSWDRVRMEQIISNLLTNAIKYAGGAPVELAIEQRFEDLVFSVRDHGKGIALEDQQRIFDRFERAFNEGKKDIEGFGLGLYIVRKIVNAHGGSIHVESQPGKGAKFVMQVPMQPYEKKNHTL